MSPIMHWHAPGRARAAARLSSTFLLSTAFVALVAAANPLQAEEKADPSKLPPVEVEQAQPAPAAKPAPKKKSPPSQAAAQAAPTVTSAGTASSSAEGGGPGAQSAIAQPGQRSGALGVPTTAEATADINMTPGGVEVVPDTSYKPSTPAATLKDVLDYVPGVWVQPKWGEDTRISIRGSSLSRNFHLRSIQLYMDGIPINTADGYGDFQEIDPTAYRYVEVFKGANALRFGANSLGGAINFVMPSGYDADAFGARVDVGSFGFHKLAASSGGVYGPADYFITGTWQEADGFRDHSWGESERGSMNVGYRLNEDAETRFYVNANEVRQRIPGSVTREAALTSPETAAAVNVANDWQRNIDTVRVANRTTLRLAPGTLLEIGSFAVDRHLMHPIFEWLDYTYNDYGGYTRLFDESRISGHVNRIVAGVNLHYGSIDTLQYVNTGGEKGALTTDFDDDAGNVSAYAENSFYFLRDVALVAGTQFLHATRERRDNFLANGDQSGETEFNLWSPKVGLLWDVSPRSQVFANISRSAEVPSFGEGVSAPAFLGLPSIPFTEIEAQRATTYEIGTRGNLGDITWDIAAYRANIDNELMCFYSAFGNCNVSNADKTVHQGLEIGFGAAVWKGILEHGATPDKLWLQTAYTLNDFFFDDDAVFGDNELPGAPPHYLRAELLYKHPSGVYFGPNVEWVPEAYYVDSANTLATEAYALLGAKVGFDNGGTVTAYVEGRNLTDETYIASSSIINRAAPDSPLFEPGTGRAVYGGVQVKW